MGWISQTAICFSIWTSAAVRLGVNRLIQTWSNVIKSILWLFLNWINKRWVHRQRTVGRIVHPELTFPTFSQTSDSREGRIYLSATHVSESSSESHRPAPYYSLYFPTQKNESKSDLNWTLKCLELISEGFYYSFHRLKWHNNCYRFQAFISCVEQKWSCWLVLLHIC